ncbi:MAG: carbohydrate ABC transporter permease, partial [Acutalibacteraceae bacterium]|nr:carbohydrate ABC transporter permease [Acutalibacteraceae bacterium]
MKSEKTINFIFTALLILASVVFLAPIVIVFLNSFKSKFSINQAPFIPPNSETFVGLENYITGIDDTNFLTAFLWSLFVTVGSVAVIVIFTSMTAWYITRVKSSFNIVLYYLFVFSMIVPFQMVMFTMSRMANVLNLDNPLGLILIYLGFGSGLSVFMFSGFVKSVPRGIEEAATIDGCNPFSTFWKVVFPILKPTAITVAILNTMWIWND